MCTVSWLLNDSGYEVFFNRDEQIGRAVALPPEYHSDLGVQYLMPVDPDGGGSWIAMNQHGLSICLLNYYQGDIPDLPLISRGQLVKSLASMASVSAIVSRLKQSHMGSYAPFTLLVFSPKLCKARGQVIAFQWDGHVLTQKPTSEPMISSSVKFEEVMAARQAAYKSIMAGEKTTAKAWEFHKSHQPQAGYLSVCMHREDANTVSFTHLDVNKDAMVMTYVGGSPCQNKQAVSFSLSDKSLQSGSLKPESIETCGQKRRAVEDLADETPGYLERLVAGDN